MSAFTLAVVNQKGGVGKTTTAVNLSAALAEAGERTLLVDLDPQMNATSGLGARGAERGLFDALNGDGRPDDFALPLGENLRLLPATPDLTGAAVGLADQPLRLREALSEASDENWIVLDAPPSLGPLSVNALAAADALVIPLQAEYYALEGLAALFDTVERVRGSLNPNLSVLGIVVTMFDNRTNLAAQVDADARRHFAGLVFETIIPRSVRLSEAPSYARSVLDYAPSSPGAQAYRRLAREVIGRRGQRGPA
ncbi:MAG TPA: ParA family protein [Deinococcales bacterium]|nr:ParA family protein [Deinococcales bacterium]